MHFIWSYPGPGIFILFVFTIAIEAITAATPPVIDLGYALHQATISPVRRTSRLEIPKLICTGKPSIFSIPKHQICCASPRALALLVPSASIE
jgi:hypothetical protein